MADEEKKDGVPGFRFPEKRVDSSWKEEVRRERERMAQQAEAKAATPKEGAPGETAPAAKGAKPKEGAGDEKAKPDETSKVFLNFIASLVQQTLMQLGQMENPMTGQRELDLEGARYTIDLLTALEKKTAGNLSDHEEQGLSQSLRDLKMYYVEVARMVQQKMKEQLDKKPPGRK
ncbi:MAG: DUF1844 domain-containing protein [Planctomycetes bacterium]|nr:DUF1844 domain-containing protein [Planctomycetota bacterium]